MRGEDKGFRHAARAMGATLDGLAACFRREAAFRQECFFGVVNAVLAVVVPRTWAESAVLIAVYFLLPITELLNSAIEETVDLVTEEWNEKAKRAKDYASAAIFLSIVLICAAWAAVLLRRFL